MLSQQVERILAAGGGISIDGSKYMSSQLERFAAQAARSGASLIIRNSNKLLSSQMERIAVYGNGQVIFEIE